jgi:hypothetical protein
MRRTLVSLVETKGIAKRLTGKKGSLVETEERNTTGEEDTTGDVAV